MAEMAKVVNRDPTAIDRCLACLKRFEVFGAIAQAVREAQWQRSDQALQGGYGQPLPLTLMNRSVSQCCYRSEGLAASRRFQRGSMAFWVPSDCVIYLRGIWLLGDVFCCSHFPAGLKTSSILNSIFHDFFLLKLFGFHPV